MKTCYDKWGKRGFLNNFIIKEFNSCTTNTLVDGSYIFKDIQFPQFDNSIDTVIHWDYPLDSLKTGIGMFQDCVNLTTFNVDLDLLNDGSYMFSNTNLSNFNSKLDKLETASYMFSACSNLISFDSKLDKLVTGTRMFFGCEKLAEFNIPLSSLINGNYMFSGCKSLKKFDVDISSIKYFQAMFNNCSNLETFIGDVSKCTNGSYTFMGCNKLKNLYAKYDADADNQYTKLSLNSLTNGFEMFMSCHRIKNFDIPLPNLQQGVGMFHNCCTYKVLASGEKEYSGLETFTSKIGTYVEPEDGEPYFEPYYSISSLWNGRFMFAGCEVLREVDINTAGVVVANSMFYDCVNLSDLKMTNLDKLLAAVNMFLGCSKLTNINADLGSLKNGYQMFGRCHGLGKNFKPNLANLLNGWSMFSECTLTTDTIEHIAKTINNVNRFKNEEQIPYSFDENGNPSVGADGKPIYSYGGESFGRIQKYIDICIRGNDPYNPSSFEPNEREVKAFEEIAKRGWTVHLHKNSILDKEPVLAPQFYANAIVTTNSGLATHTKSDGTYVILAGGAHVYTKLDDGTFVMDDNVPNYKKYKNKADAIEKLNLIAIKK